MKLIQYSNGNYTVEVQFQPFSLPMGWEATAPITRLGNIKEKYAMLVWSQAGLLEKVQSSNSLDTLLEEAPRECKSRLGIDIERYQAGRHRIKDNKIVRV